MFTLPSLPADSYYKFCFMAGIIILVFSVYTMNNSINFASDHLRSTDSLMNVSKAFLAIDSSMMSMDKNEPKGIYSEKELKAKLLELKRRFAQSISLNNLIDFYHKRNSEEIALIKSRVIAFFIGISLGCGLIIYGSIMWVWRVQIPHDKILDMQVLLMEKELESANIKPYHKQIQPQIFSKRFLIKLNGFSFSITFLIFKLLCLHLQPLKGGIF